MLTQRKGRITEQAALDYLRLQGLRLITRNYSCRLGEIDLIMVQHGKPQPKTLVFVEVRYRQSKAYGGAAASVNFKKRARLIRTASQYLQTHSKYQAWPCRFDVVALTGGLDALSINWLVGAFES